MASGPGHSKMFWEGCEVNYMPQCSYFVYTRRGTELETKDKVVGYLRIVASSSSTSEVYWIYFQNLLLGWMRVFLGQLQLGRELIFSTGLHSLLTYEPRDDLFLGVSKFVKYIMIHYMFSIILCTKYTARRSRPHLVRSIKASVLRGCYTVLYEFKQY